MAETKLKKKHNQNEIMRNIQINGKQYQINDIKMNDDDYPKAATVRQQNTEEKKRNIVPIGK